MNANYADAPKLAQPAREPMVIEVVAFARSLAERAGQLAERTYGKLAPVMVSAPPCDAGCPEKEREWPPLFAELRGQFFSISNALNGIEDALSRTEL